MAQIATGQSRASESMDAVVDALMLQLTGELIQLGRIPSISDRSYPPEPVHQARDFVADLLRSV